MLIGVNDTGSVTGIDDFKRIMVEIPNKSRDLMGVTVSLNEKQENDYRYFESRGHLFSVMFYKAESTEKSSEKSSGKSSGKSSEKILNLIKNNPETTIANLAKQLGMSTRAIEKQISTLKKRSLIIRIGPAK
jgi:predicted HTH transcriptional regulator